MNSKSTIVSKPPWDEDKCPNLKRIPDKTKVFYWAYQPEILYGCKLWLCILKVDDKTFKSEMHTTNYHAVANAVDKYLNSLD